MFNPSPIDKSISRLPLGEAWLLIFNEIEGAALAGCDDEEGILNTLRQRWPRCRLLLTLGSHGCVYDNGQRRLRRASIRWGRWTPPPPEIPSPVTSWPVWRRGVRRRSVWIWRPVRPAPCRVTARRRSVYPHHGRGAALHPPAEGSKSHTVNGPGEISGARAFCWGEYRAFAADSLLFPTIQREEVFPMEIPPLFVLKPQALTGRRRR